MAWGYGSDELPWGLWFSLFFQVALLVWLLTPGFHRLTLRSRTWTVVGWALGVVANQALLQLLSPTLGVGVTSGILTLFVLIPVCLTNGLLLVLRTATRDGVLARLPLLLPLLCGGGFWAWRLLSFP
jgi:hypothetical protein